MSTRGWCTFFLESRHKDITETEWCLKLGKDSLMMVHIKTPLERILKPSEEESPSDLSKILLSNKRKEDRRQKNL